MRSYAERQRSFDCQTGDRVKIFCKPNLDEWENNWNNQMNRCVGKMGTIISIKHNGILIKVDGVQGSIYQSDGWYFPYTALEIIR